MVARQDLLKFANTSLSTKEDQLLAIERVKHLARLDIGREMRKGLPEIILAEGKTASGVAKIVHGMVQRTGRAIVSRANENYVRRIHSERIPKIRIQFFRESGMVVVKRISYSIKKSGGRVGILTAGTSDIPIAEEARIVADEMGCETLGFYDVGVAGLHRLFKPLAELLRWDADVILVVAGREGALPTVVAGIADVPVIGVPTSRSYGFGDRGVAALAAMLQSCSLGLAVVNIDSGVGGGSVGALIANRAAQTRRRNRGN